MDLIYLCTIKNNHILYDKKTTVVYSTDIIRYDEGNNNKQCFFGSDMVNYGLLSKFEDTCFISRLVCINAHIFCVVYYEQLIYPKNYGDIPVKDILETYILEKILGSI